MVRIIIFEEKKGVKLDVEKIITNLKTAGCNAVFLNSGSLAKKHGDPYDLWVELLTQKPIGVRARKVVEQMGGRIL
ncbi:MAG TPA: hypothetical protein VJ624_00980 [Thermodesulfobacteriota bacterium]|nr:hypothetical protein [Thermodesulfobacteriota bacterium]